MERSALAEAYSVREKMGVQFFHHMANTYHLNRHFVLSEFFHICSNIVIWFFSCAGGKFSLHEAESLYTMRYHGRMPCIFLNLK